MNLKNLTNEKLSAYFENPFSMVNYAISVAKDRIEHGDLFESNAANEVLESIAKNKEFLKKPLQAPQMIEEEEDEAEEELVEEVL